MVTPRLIRGSLAVDDRGEVGFVNEFDFAGVKRFYTVTNHAIGFVRAWHGHRREEKFVTVVQGAMLIACVEVDDWQNPSRDLEVLRFVLSAKTPAVLYIPAGYANGNMSLTADAKAIFFSTATLEESRSDDIRFDARLWDAWSVAER
jgi:dTDP-4-dehydrorhamnose 3,5-epimerase